MESERQFRILLASNPQNEVALNNLACLVEDMGRETEAETLYEKALVLNPDYVEARNNYGVLLCKRKQYTAGIEQMEAATLSRPSCLPPHYNLGKAYFEVGNHQAAVRHWERYLKQDASRSAWVLRAERHVEEARNRLAASRSDPDNVSGKSR